MQPVAGEPFWQGSVSARLDALGAWRSMAPKTPRRAQAWKRLGKRFASPLLPILLLASVLSAATGVRRH